jgi:predicted nucleic acid-binding protein
VNVFVADASVAAKWVLPGADEPLSAEALRLLRRWTDGEIQLIVPDFFWTELANILWKMVRRGRCTRQTAEAALATLRAYKIPAFPALALLDSPFDKAVIYGRSVYDSLYVALAVESNAQLVTADEKLANALVAHLPVIWLGSI